MTRLTILAAAVGAALLSASAASAAPGVATVAQVAGPDYRVVYGDLDLSAADGAARFDRRVDRAARNACATGWRWGEIECRNAFRDEAVRNLPSTHRDDYARGRSGAFQTNASTVRR